VHAKIVIRLSRKTSRRGRITSPALRSVL
jgi:hypothetical protein